MMRPMLSHADIQHVLQPTVVIYILSPCQRGRPSPERRAWCSTPLQNCERAQDCCPVVTTQQESRLNYGQDARGLRDLNDEEQLEPASEHSIRDDTQ